MFAPAENAFRYGVSPFENSWLRTCMKINFEIFDFHLPIIDEHQAINNR